MLIALKIITAITVAATLSLYLYDNGAHRVYDVVMSTLVIILTSPIAIVLAIMSKAKNNRVFDRADGGLRFTCSDNALKKLPFFYLVFIGKRSILPVKLGRKKKEPCATPEQ